MKAAFERLKASAMVVTNRKKGDRLLFLFVLFRVTVYTGDRRERKI
jgi:hypothetical protein